MASVYDKQILGLGGSMVVPSGMLVTGDFSEIFCIGATAFTTLTDSLEKTTAEYGTAASGTITYTGLPTAAQTVTVNAIVYTYRAAPTLATEILIGADLSAMAANTAAAVGAHDPLVSLAAVAGVVTVTAMARGTGGNSFTLATNGTNTAVSGAGTLAGGLNLVAGKTPTYPAGTILRSKFTAVQPSAASVRVSISVPLQ